MAKKSKPTKTENPFSKNDDTSSKVRHIYPTGCLPFDAILGGGIPSSRIVEIYGWEATFKTTTAITFARAFQQYWEAKDQKHVVIWIECESTLDTMRARYLGLNTDNLQQTDLVIVEDIFDKIENDLDLAKDHGYKIMFVIDTLAATKTRNEAEEGQFSGGRQEKPRVIGDRLTKLVKRLGETDTTLVFTNQVYDAGLQGLVSKGGVAPKYYASIRLLNSKAGSYKEKDEDKIEHEVGKYIKITTKKNKMMMDGYKAILLFKKETGLDNEHSLLKYLTDNNLLKSSGSWKTININGEEHKFQNAEKLKELMDSTPLVKDYLEYQVYLFPSKKSSLFKVKNINKLWDLEEKLFGERKTILSELETNCLSMLED